VNCGTVVEIAMQQQRSSSGEMAALGLGSTVDE